MKVLATISVAALATLGLTAQASAFSLSPKSASFTGAGAMTVAQGLFQTGCSATFTGTIDASGAGSVTGAAFAGSLTCLNIKPLGLPWATTATGAGAATIAKVSVQGPLGVCGPTDLPVAVSNSGVLTFNGPLSGGCGVASSSGVATSPAVTVTNP